MEKLKASGSLSDQAYNILKSDIINNKISPLEILVEEQVADQLGISRTPVRTAIKRLAYEGLVNIESKVTRVSKVSFKEAQDYQILRESLEPLAANLACIQMEPEKLKQLKDIYQRQQECIENYDWFIKLDTEFHCKISEFSNNNKLLEFITSLRNQLQRYLILTKPTNAIDALKEHQEILEALELRDPIKTRGKMEIHIKKVSQRFLDHE